MFAEPPSPPPHDATIRGAPTPIVVRSQTELIDAVQSGDYEAVSRLTEGEGRRRIHSERLYVREAFNIHI
jgi:hypothetical protein